MLEDRCLLSITANPDVYSLASNAPLVTGATNGVTANDTTTDTTPAGSAPALVPVVVAQPTKGSLALNNDGSFTYTASPGATGDDSFTYLDDDGISTSNTATVTLHINPVTLFPTAVQDTYNFSQNTPLTVAAPGVLANDVTPQGGPLTAKLVSNVSHGALTLNADGSFTYTPATDSTLTDSFTYDAVDAGGLTSQPATVTLNFNGQAPTIPSAVADAFTVAQEKTLAVSAPGVLLNDSGAGGGQLSAVLQNSTAHGSLGLNADGSFSYTPDLGFHGTDSFTYFATNGKSASPTPATVTITVTQVFHAPVAADDAFTVAEDATLSVPAAGVLANDTDVDTPAQTLTASVVNPPQHGALTLNADGSFTYTPTARYSGADSFTYRAAADGLSSNLATVTLTVTPVAHPPTANPDSYSTRQGTTLTVAGPGVLLNDTDPDGRPLTAVVATNPTSGTLALNADGSFAYTPDPSFHGLDSFTYFATNGQFSSPTPATVTITVSQVFRAPVASNDAYTVTEGVATTISAPGVLANDTDPNSLAPALTATLVNQPQHGSLTFNSDGSFTYTSASDFSGADSFTYRASSEGLTSNLATVTLTVTPVPRPPVAGAIAFTTNENQALSTGAPGLLLNSTDPDGRPLAAIVDTNPAHGTVVLLASGAFTYTPSANFNGTDTFTFSVSDGVLNSGPATATITVNAVAQPPIAQNATFSTEEDSTLTVPAPGLLATASGFNGTTLTTAVVTTPPNGTLRLAADGSFSYVPNFGFSGTDSFTYRVIDGPLASNLATVTIDVASIATTTVFVDPATVTGVSATGASLSNKLQPVFNGTTLPGVEVVLFGRPAGFNTPPNVIGQTTADASGQFKVQSVPLPDGTYEFFAESFRPNGQSTGRVPAGDLTIATASPRIYGSYLIAGTGQIELDLAGTTVGFNAATLTNLSNYAFYSQSGSKLRNLTITGVQVVPASGPGALQVVLLQTNQKRLGRGTFVLQVASAGIADRAGNLLDGNFIGTLPTGDGQPGSPFKAAFVNKGRNPVVGTPTTIYIPTTVSTSVVKAASTSVVTAKSKVVITGNATKAAPVPVVTAATILGPLPLLKKSVARKG